MLSDYMWIGFGIVVVVIMAIDLGVFNRKAHEIRLKEALISSVIYISLALIFGLGILYLEGKQKALEFYTGYLIEESLSVDNLFVFIVIFKFFNTPKRYQHRVLFWGIIGALIMRAVFIFSGITLINKFHWIIYVFGVFLIYTGINLFFEKEKQVDPSKNIIIRLSNKLFPVIEGDHGGRFFVRHKGKTFTTSLFIVLLMIEFTDLIFAVDSIPAVLAISKDPFIVYTSNIFAIMGLRSLYFALSEVMKYFTYLKYGLAAVLTFVGIKMTISSFFPIPITIALLVIIIFLLIPVVVSLILRKSK